MNRPALKLKSFSFIFFLLLFSCRQDQRESSNKFNFFDPKDQYVTAPGKKEMILRTERPLNLETPQKYFLQDFTPNDVFFVRWHLSELPEAVNTDTFRLRIYGNVKTPLSLSLKDLKTNFKPITLPALAVCAGNARKQFDPRVPGVQWNNGAMGNAKWTGVSLKELLSAAVMKKGSVDVSFNGLDDPPLGATPDFIKSLPLEKVLSEEVIVAYAMNGDSIPLLNGYPLKLIVPGWYATYWIGMLSEIRVNTDTFDGFWMKKAYQIPKGKSNADERPDSLASVTEPIRRIAIRSIFVAPEEGSTLSEGSKVTLEGLAFDGGNGIAKAELSSDSGRTWMPAKLEPEIGSYSWRRWKYEWIAEGQGKHQFMVRATSKSGETQPIRHWNRSGYSKNQIEVLTLYVR